MSWFGGGKKEEAPTEKGFSDGSIGMDTPASPSMMGGGGGSSTADFQQFSMALQQQMLIQQVVSDLSHRVFMKCVTESGRDPKLTGRQVACIASATNKWLDANEYLMGRLAKKQELQQNASQFG